MIRQLVALKLTLLGNLFRRSIWRVVGLVLGLAYGASISAIAVAVLVALRFTTVHQAAVVVTIGGSVAVLAHLVVPIFTGVDDTLDPARFAVFGIPRGRLAIGLAVAACIGIPSLAVAIVSLGTVVTWSRAPLSLVVAVIAWPVAAATCVLLARVSAAGASLVLATRRAKETTSGIAFVLLMLIGPVLAAALLAVDAGGAVREVLRAIAAWLAWTPVGAVWAAPASIAAGDLIGLVQLAYAVAVLATLWFAWRALVGLALVTPARPGRAREFRGLGWFGRVPGTPAWAIGARSLTYWTRDGRYRMALLALPVTPIAILVPLAIAGVPGATLALLPVPAVALFLGWTAHNDVAYDHTAVWLHVAAGVRGSADRIGRAMPVLALGVPVVLLGSVISAAVAGDSRLALPLIGVSSCLLLAGLGLSSVSSARFPYPVPRPGDSPFQQPNATGGLSAAVQSVTFVLEILFALPAILAMWAGFGGGMSWWVASLGLGVGVGGLVLWWGVRAGSRSFERRGPELLQAALRA